MHVNCLGGKNGKVELDEWVAHKIPFHVHTDGASFIIHSATFVSPLSASTFIYFLFLFSLSIFFLFLGGGVMV